MSSRRAAGNSGAHHAHKKQRKNQEKEDLQVLQDQLREAQEAERRAREENEALRQQLAENQAPEPNRAPANGGAGPSKSQIESWKRIGRVAGCRAAALHAPFLDADVLADQQVSGNFDKILEQVQKAKDSDEELEDSDNPAIYWDTARFTIPEPIELAWEMIYHLPKSPGKLWLDEWFQDAVKLGIRKQRGDIVFAIAKSRRQIFGIANPDFDDRLKRAELPEVQELMHSFMHIGEETPDGQLDLSQFFRDTCIVRVLRLLMHGDSAILTGHRSSKARKSHAQLWHVRSVTPSLLAFATAMIKFVLSGEPSFEENTIHVNYTDWFLSRLVVLEGVHTHYPDAYEELIDFYNRSVFPDTYHKNDAGEAEHGDGDKGDGGMAGLSEQDKAFLARLEAQN